MPRKIKQIIDKYGSLVNVIYHAKPDENTIVSHYVFQYIDDKQQI